uniref:Aromatic-L-amino-acid decarboxylase n=1 Tax=Clytia hemisphaerica TaxID=252671 RepID=A0A7M5V8C6_9CNID
MDGKHSMRGEVLESAIKEDKAKGLMPIFCLRTLGTTSLCSFDAIDEISAVAKQEGLWVNVDAAYAGAALICPEYRYLITNWNGIDSFALSCNKWLMVTADCAVMFVRDSLDLLKTFNVDPLYLKHQYQKEAVDFRHWQIPLCRRFRSLKLWMVFKCYGVAGLQHNIRKQTQQAKMFENLVKSDSRFEVVNDVKMGLVCFRLIGDNSLSEELNNRVNEAEKFTCHLLRPKKNIFCVWLFVRDGQ